MSQRPFSSSAASPPGTTGRDRGGIEFEGGELAHPPALAGAETTATTATTAAATGGFPGSGRRRGGGMFGGYGDLWERRRDDLQSLGVRPPTVHHPRGNVRKEGRRHGGGGGDTRVGDNAEYESMECAPTHEGGGFGTTARMGAAPPKRARSPHHHHPSSFLAGMAPTKMRISGDNDAASLTDASTATDEDEEKEKTSATAKDRDLVPGATFPRTETTTSSSPTSAHRLVPGLSIAFQGVGLGTSHATTVGSRFDDCDTDNSTHPIVVAHFLGDIQPPKGAGAGSGSGSGATVVTATTQGSSLSTTWHSSSAAAAAAVAAAAGVETSLLSPSFAPTEGANANAGPSGLPTARVMMTPLPPAASELAAKATAAAAAGTATATAQLETPKTVLHRLYGKPPRRKVLSSSDYYTWNDNGPTHALKWTSAFLCPLTGEVFVSGRYGDESSYTVSLHHPRQSSAGGVAAVTTKITPENPGGIGPFPTDDEEALIVVWYGKKTVAEHAAAARVLDCQLARDDAREGIVYRDGQGRRWGRDVPYLEPNWSIPSSVPDPVRVSMEQRQAQIRHGYPAA